MFNQSVSILKGDVINLDSSLVLEYEKSKSHFLNKVVVSDGNRELTFEQFDLVVNYISEQLSKHDEEYVFIISERNIWIPILFWACIKANKVYAPIDITLPTDRIIKMIRSVDSSILYASKDIFNDIESSGICFNFFDLTKIISQNVSLVKSNEFIQTKAFLLYTSGTTGEPKGILGTRIGLYNRMMWMKEEFSICSDDIIMYKTPISFDVHLWEIILPFITGAKLVILPENEHRFINKMIKRIIKEKVTRIHFVPSVFRIFIKYIKDKSSFSLKSIFCSGEALQVMDVELFNEVFDDVSLVNLYGPAEASVDVTYFYTSRENELKKIPIGKPIPNTSIFILDDDLKPVPFNTPGEIYIAGTSLAEGYTNPSLTEKKFLLCPFLEGQKMYHTGDMGQVDDSGNILFLGRKDKQVKLHGVRIELEEIETEILKNQLISDVAVVFDDEINQIKAYIVGNIDYNILKNQLSKKLPSYYIPASFIRVDKIPITSNGKRDVKSLLAL